MKHPIASGAVALLLIASCGGSDDDATAEPENLDDVQEPAVEFGDVVSDVIEDDPDLCATSLDGVIAAIEDATPDIEIDEDSLMQVVQDECADVVAGDDPSSELGTQDAPLPFGSEVELDDWSVLIGETTKDATDAVLAENEFNDSPVDDRQFVMANVTATYTGDESGTAWVDLSFRYVGSEGNTFSTGEDDYCGSIPDDHTDAGEAFPGAEVSGNMCVSVPSGQVDGGAWMVEELIGSRAFVAVE